MELDVSTDPNTFSEMTPGDAIGIVTENPSELVEGVLTRLGLEPTRQVKIEMVTQTGE